MGKKQIEEFLLNVAKGGIDACLKKPFRTLALGVGGAALLGITGGLIHLSKEGKPLHEFAEDFDAFIENIMKKK